MNSLLALLGLAVFSTAFALVYFRLIRARDDRPRAALFAGADGVAASVVFLGEQLSSTAWIRLACIIVGVAAMKIPERRTKPVSEAVMTCG